MPYNTNLASRIREYLVDHDILQVEEKEMMGGLSFMVNSKMCIGIIKEEIICRIDPLKYESSLEKIGCRPMDFTGRPMIGWIFIEEIGFAKTQDFNNWMELALEYNSKAKASKKKKPKA